MFQNLPSPILWVLQQLYDAGYDAYLVGGCVRDELMHRVCHDFDITTNALPEQTMAIFKQTSARVIPTGLKHGTITVLIEDEPVEITTYRMEDTYVDHRSPSNVSFTTNLKEDLQRRDFTMNAIAYDPRHGCYDPYHGQDDIKHHIIRCVGDPYERLQEDALRILRAIRFSCMLNFRIDESLQQAIKDCAPTLSYISSERIRDEFNKMLVSKKSNLLHMLYEYRVLDHILPGYSSLYGHLQKTPWHIYDIFTHTDVALNHALNDPLENRLALTFHDIGKPDMETFDEQGIAHYKKHAIVSEEKAKAYMEALRYDHKTIQKVCTLIRYHDYYVQPKRKVLRKFLTKFDNDIAFAMQALQVQRADDLAKNMEKAQEKLDILYESMELLQVMEKEKDFIHKKDLAVNGHDMMKLGLQGSAIGSMLQALYERVVEDPSLNTKETLYQIVKETITH